VTEDCTFAELAGTDGWAPMIQTPSTMTDGGGQSTRPDEGVGVFDGAGGC
jgi:hypothetical protein